MKNAKNYFKFLIFVIVNLPYFCLFSRSIEHTVHTSFIEESVNGKKFSFRLDSVDGVVKEHWLAHGKPVTKQIYDELIVQADLEERKTEREKEYQQHIAEVEFKQNVQNQVTKKLLQALISEIDHERVRIEGQEIKPYFLFESETFSSFAEYDSLAQMLVPIREFLSNNNVPIEKTKEYIKTLEVYPKKLKKFFEHSLKNAVTICDDPKILKRLLELVS